MFADLRCVMICARTFSMHYVIQHFQQFCEGMLSGKRYLKLRELKGISLGNNSRNMVNLHSNPGPLTFVPVLFPLCKDYCHIMGRV